MQDEHVETVHVRGGQGGLTLHVHGLDVVLCHLGHTAVFTWMDREDADHRAFVRAHDLNELDASLGVIDLAAHSSLATALRHVLDHLPDGRYRLVHMPLPDVEPDRPGPEDRPRSTGEMLDWAGLHHAPADEALLLGTVPRDLIDPSVVRDMVHHIQSGLRPAVVVLSEEEGDVGFLIAGHAAFEAYRRLGMPPHLVHIDVLDPLPLTAEQGALALADAYTRVGEIASAHYRAMRAAQRSLATA